MMCLISYKAKRKRQPAVLSLPTAVSYSYTLKNITHEVLYEHDEEYEYSSSLTSIQDKYKEVKNIKEKYT